MKKTLFEYLSWANPKNDSDSEEEYYFHHHLSSFSPETRIYRRDDDFFTLLKAVLVLKGLENRKVINSYLLENKDHFDSEHYRQFLRSLPQNRDKKQPVLIPTYSPSINKRYFQSPISLFSFPYEALLKDEKVSLVPVFEVYGNTLFSSFTNLLPLEIHDMESQAFYHEKRETVFLINNLGGLECEIPLFDEKMKVKDKTDLKKRLSLLVKNYYENDKAAFLEHLLSLGLISPSLHQRLVDYDKRREQRIERIRYR